MIKILFIIVARFNIKIFVKKNCSNMQYIKKIQFYGSSIVAFVSIISLIKEKLNIIALFCLMYSNGSWIKKDCYLLYMLLCNNKNFISMKREYRCKYSYKSVSVKA